MLSSLFARTGCVALLTLQTALVSAQPFWGNTQDGGDYNIGVVYTLTEGGVYTKKHDFFRYLGGTPKSDLLKASNGLYYGVTEADGTETVGVLFSYHPVTEAYTVLVNFTTASTGASAIGNTPVRGLVQASDGLIYGLCQKGGLQNHGTLFSFNTTTGVVTRLVSFTGTNGSQPYSKLVLGSTGTTMWGTTSAGGANSSGTIFQYTVGGALAVRHNFSSGTTAATGRIPRYGLTKTTNGRLFGVAATGGSGSLGTVFEINMASPYTVTVIRALTAVDGGQPVGGLVEGATNVLYGATTNNGANGAGTIYRVDATTTPATFTKVHDLTASVASNIYSAMCKGTNGLLYGTSLGGSTSGQGCIFSYNMTTNVLTPLASFNSAGLSATWGGLVQDGSVFYGLSSVGGGGSGGGLFRFDPTAATITPLISFSLANGSSPRGRMLMASNGKLYGLTNKGGSFGQGTLFSIDPNTSVFTRIMDLGGTNGTFPQGTLCEVSGKLYGMCTDGGANAAGTIFEYDLSSNVFTKKLDLQTANGSRPMAGFTLASNGSLYTTTYTGGANGVGSIVRYVPSTNTLTKVYDLSSTAGANATAALLALPNGMMYGVAARGGVSNAGTLFSFNPVNNAFVKLYDFDFLQGGAPVGDLMQAANGKLYGMCSEEGLYFNGCVYSWDITSGTYTEEFDMQNAQGRFSEGNLAQGADGMLYGTCVQGGTNDVGTLFRFNPNTAAYTLLHNFTTATTGKFPMDGLVRQSATLPSTELLLNAKVFLEGPYVTATARMNDGLRTLTGSNGFPLTEPFTGLGFTHAGGGGGEAINASVLTVTGDNAIVDWVLVELRNKTTPSIIVRTRSALLQRDGDVVGLDGTSVLGINAAADDYYVAVRARNHFGVMTSNARTLSSSSTLALNFTNGTVATYGTNAQKVSGSVRLNWAGNSRKDATLKYTGADNDRDPILVRVGGAVPTATVNGYFIEDVNMNGAVKYTGADNDRDPILVNVGGSVPTATRTEQLP